MTQPAPMERTQERTQKRGAYLALAVAGAFVALIGYFVISGRGTPTTPSNVPRRATEARVPLGKGSSDGQLLPAKGVRLDLFDKKEPTRQTGLILFATMDPLEGHRYAVETPEAWLYLSGGRSVYIRPDSGLVYSPDRQKEPESGTITGNVEMKMFEAGLDPNTIDPATTKALMVFKTDSLAFEHAATKASTPDQHSLVWEGGKLEGTGLSFVFNQPEQRLERGEIERDGKLTLTRTAKKDKPAKEPPAATPPPSGEATAAAPAPTTPPKSPVETLYRLIAGGDVVASQAQRTLHADGFQVFARLLDNKLPEGAIPEVRFARRAPPSEAAANTPNPAALPAPAEVVKSEPSSGDGEALVLTWKGPCTIIPLATAPPELKDNHIAARFTSEPSKKVTLADRERGIDGHAAMIEYAATSRVLSLIGPDPSSVRLSVPESGQILTSRIDADLAAGIIKTPGAGTLTSLRQGQSEQNLSWAERGEFAFQVLDGALTGLLKQASIFGGVKGDGRGLSFTSREASAAFAPAKPEQKQAVLSSIDLTGDAAAQSQDTGTMSGQKLHVRFDPPATEGGDAQPRFVRAEESFIVERAGERLSGDYLESTLIDIAEGKVDVGTVLARGGVKFKSEKDFISGQTEELRADLGLDEEGKRKQLVELIGADTFIARDEPGREQGRVTGMQMSIDGVRGRLEVFGVGTFAYKGESGANTSSIEAAWMRRMFYDDSAGLIDCWGDAMIRYAPDGNTRDKVVAERVKLAITPGLPGESILSARPDAPRTDGASQAGKRDRSILSAEAHGSILDREGGQNAWIESRAYADGDKDLQKLSYVEGPSILANNQTGMIDVPGRGKFLLLDQSAARAASVAPGSRDLGGDTRGVSLFEWATALHVEKQAMGETTMLMKDEVSVIHRALKDGQVTEIKCAEILANLKDGSGSLGGSGRGLELQSVHATGSVYAASGPPKTADQPRPPLRELIAQRLEYDAIQRRIEARANAGGVVTMFEPTTASPTTAAWLVWDLEKNSIQVRQPSGVAPR